MNSIKPLDNSDESIDEILAEFTDAAADGPRLDEWIAKYPRHEKEIVRYALFHEVVSAAEPLLPEDPAAEQQFAERAGKVRERLRASGAVRLAAAELCSGILADARAAGLAPAKLAERLGIGMPLLTKLERRLVRPETIPSSLIARLSEALDRSVGALSDYLRMQPTLAATASYKSAEAPRVAEQESFDEALEADPTMSEEQKRAWRAELSE